MAKNYIFLMADSQILMDHTSQCENLRFFLPIRFYVKSNLGECKLKFLREIEFWQI